MNIDEARAYLNTYKIKQAKIGRMEQMMSEYPEKREKYRAQLISATKTRDKIEEEIDALDGNVLSEILSQKYICGRTLEEISYLLNYSKRQTERLHIKALSLFSKY